MAAREAAAMPLPREETTPPVTNTYLVIVIYIPGVTGQEREIWIIAGSCPLDGQNGEYSGICGGPLLSRRNRDAPVNQHSHPGLRQEGYAGG